MTRSVYIIGGAGTGKSTFTAQLIEEMGLTFGPLESLYSRHNGRGTVHLRGHKLSPGYGIYLGVNREHHPGTDGLDWTSSPSGEQWLRAGDLPAFIIGEGATLSTKRFLGALAETTELMIILLTAPPEVVEERFGIRNTDQDRRFVKATVSRSENMAQYMHHHGAQLVMSCDTSKDTTIMRDIAKGFLQID
jgi:hypothetical protein